MESSKRRVGRPKASPPMGPLVLSEDRSRTKVEVELAAATARELGDYTRWVELSAGMSTAEATGAAVDFALRNVFRRDRLWQQHRRDSRRAEDVADLPASAPPTAHAPSSPPPSHGNGARTSKG